MTVADEQREDRSAETDVGFLQRATAMLAEHFDTVQVFCTRDIGEGGTVSVKYGTGSWYARMGQVKEWVLTEDACAAAKSVRLSADSEEDKP